MTRLSVYVQGEEENYSQAASVAQALFTATDSQAVEKL